MARAKLCWDQIKGWLRSNFVEGLNSLVPGASLDEIKAAEKELGFQLPPSVRLLYQLCNGQELSADDCEYDNYSECSNYVGLLGGYYFYNHFVNVRFLPLQQLVDLTLAVRESEPRHRYLPQKRRVVIAASCHSPKVFFLDCDDGQVYVRTRNWQRNGETMPCTPNRGDGVDAKDGMLRWLEQYNHCLQTGQYNVRAEKGIRGISLFPMKEPFRTEAVTNRLQVKKELNLQMVVVFCF